jgi:hypothetical protein
MPAYSRGKGVMSAKSVLFIKAPRETTRPDLRRSNDRILRIRPLRRAGRNIEAPLGKTGSCFVCLYLHSYGCRFDSTFVLYNALCIY